VHKPSAYLGHLTTTLPMQDATQLKQTASQHHCRLWPVLTPHSATSGRCSDRLLTAARQHHHYPIKTLIPEANHASQNAHNLSDSTLLQVHTLLHQCFKSLGTAVHTALQQKSQQATYHSRRFTSQTHSTLHNT